MIYIKSALVGLFTFFVATVVYVVSSKNSIRGITKGN
jgi:hypothetical protein